MEMKLYHGSDTFIEEIDLGKSKSGRDFGQGFYVTNLLDQARTMAERVARWNKTKPVITEFEFDGFALVDRDMKVLRFDNYNDEWLDFVVLNRQNKLDTHAHDYDIVEGPVADDKVSTRINEFMDGKISREQFMSDLVYNPSHQICFCTAQSLQALSPPKERRLISYDIFHIGDEVMQVLMKDYGLSEIEATDIYHTSQTYAAVADESTGYYQKPWQDIYDLLRAELKI